MYPPYESGPIVGQSIYFAVGDTAHHDIYEQIWGWSQVFAMIAAGIAIFYAIRSANDARRAVENSEEALEIAQAELAMMRAEANRKPDLTVVPTIYPSP